MYTLQDIQKIAEKQSKNKKYMGYFQNEENAGIPPINAAFFNTLMGSNFSDNGDFTGDVSFDAGVSGSLGEDLEEPVEEASVEEVTTFYLASPDNEGTTRTVEVDKDNVLKILGKLLREDPEFLDLDEEAFKSVLRDRYQVLRDTHYNDISNYLASVINREESAEEVEAPEEPEETVDDIAKTTFETVNEEFDANSGPAWTDIYAKFLEVADRYFPDEEKIAEEVDKLYDRHAGDDVWDVAYDRWLNSTEYHDTYDSEDTEEDFESEEEQEEIEEPIEECIHKEVYIPRFQKQARGVYDGGYDDSYDIEGEELEFEPVEEEETTVDYDDEPLQESLDDYDISEIRKNIMSLENQLDFLDNVPASDFGEDKPFDNEQEVQKARKDTERELHREQFKYKVLSRKGNRG